MSSVPIPVQGIDHIAIAVPDLAGACEFYRQCFGCDVSAPVEVREQGVRTAYVQLGNVRIELMEPLDDGSPISKFLQRHPGGGIHHLCLTTSDAERAAKNAKAAGLRIVGEGTTTSSAHERRLFFIHPKDTWGTLIEIEDAEV